ncbi:TetR/AcrR family transcriptional regulator [Nocardiopsis coralliicola]
MPDSAGPRAAEDGSRAGEAPGGGDPARRPERREVVAAAVRLFERAGYEATTMGDIAEAAGLSRRSLFRRFGTKEDLLFSELDDLADVVRRHLDAARGGDPVAAVVGAARMVFGGYVASPVVAAARFRLVRAVPRLRDREIAMTARYQAAFSRHLAGGESDGERALAAEAVAAAVIAAHNHVLRGWLRAPADPPPWDRLDAAMAFVTGPLADRLRSGAPEPAAPGGVVVAVYPAGTGTAEVLRGVRTALEQSEPDALGG